MTVIRGREHRLLVEALYSYGGDREDRLTEVFASLMEVHPRFCRLLAGRLGVQGEPDGFVIQTQAGHPGQRRLVDLVLIASNKDGATLATVFVECKYNPTRKTEPYWFSEDQAERQRRALEDQQGQRILAAVCSKEDLDRVSVPLRNQPPFDPHDAYDPVITWSEVRELARAVAGGSDWEAEARSARATLADRLMLEFLTYIDLKGEPVGALADDDLFVLARYAQSMDRVDRLLWRVSETLARRMTAVDGTDGIEFEKEEEVEETAEPPRVWLAADGPEGTWISELREGSLYVMVAGGEYDDDEEVGTPTVYAGLGWNAGRAGKLRTAGSKWEKAANEAGLDLRWTGTACNLVAARPLEEIAKAGGTVARQADAFAAWAHQSILTALRLPPPPDADQDEADSQAA